MFSINWAKLRIGSISEPKKLTKFPGIYIPYTCLQPLDRKHFFVRNSGCEFWFFSRLLTSVVGVSYAEDSVSVRISTWYFFINFWTKLLHFLPWIAEVLAQMAPVYEGKRLKDEPSCSLVKTCRTILNLSTWWRTGYDWRVYQLLVAKTLMIKQFKMCYITAMSYGWLFSICNHIRPDFYLNKQRGCHNDSINCISLSRHCSPICRSPSVPYQCIMERKVTYKLM